MMKNQFTDALTRWGAEGVERFRAEGPPGEVTPALSHVCFKFGSAADYAAAKAMAGDLGAVIRKNHNGKEIVWCRLHDPVQSKGLRLEWLELVEPKGEPAAISGISAIGYAVSGLAEVVKIPSRDGGVIFRYQSRHAAELASG